MSEFCPKCGSPIGSNDRFCGDCGFEIQSLASPDPVTQTAVRQPVQVQSCATEDHNMSESPVRQGGTVIGSDARKQAAAGHFENRGSKSSGNRNALVIMISLLAALFLAGGGLYWWLDRGDRPGTEPSVSTAKQNDKSSIPGSESANTNTDVIDLSCASAYLPEPGYKYTFSVNYPDGMAGTVHRISARVVPNEIVRVSEVETGVEQGEAFGHGFHYVERPDGTYYILDETPNEIFPVIKNNLTVGQSWNYQDEYGKVTWTVVDMGIDLNLGFAAFEDCLLVKEDNQAVGFQSITYYAPGRGSILVVDPGGKTEYYKLTALEQIDLAQATETVKKWCPNYYDIKDDRTQSY